MKNINRNFATGLKTEIHSELDDRIGRGWFPHPQLIWVYREDHQSVGVQHRGSEALVADAMPLLPDIGEYAVKPVRMETA
jgi:hypothetical protein